MEHSEEKRTLLRLAIGTLLLLAALLARHAKLPRLSFFCFLFSFGTLACAVLYRAAKSILHRTFFDENVLTGLASLGAFCLGEFTEGCAVLLLWQLGEWFQDRAVERSRASVAALSALRPDTVTLLRPDSKEETVSPEDVRKGARILVKPGSRIPLDGIVREGSGGLDTAAITGESLPHPVSPGTPVISGSVSLDAALIVEVTASYRDSAVSRILKLVEDAENRKAKAETFITRFAKIYTPAVGLAALLTAFLPPLLLHRAFLPWIKKALTFLVISCPCALVVSVPLTFYAGVGAASRYGILIKGGNHLEMLARLRILAFDKTGTLTEGHLRLARIEPIGLSEHELLFYAAHAELHSAHPIADSLKKAYGETPDAGIVTDSREHAGIGIESTVNGKKVTVTRVSGDTAEGGTAVRVTIDGIPAGVLFFEDTIKENVSASLASLRQRGIRRIVLLTGDRTAAARKIAEQLGLDAFYAELMPEDKVRIVRQLQETEKLPVGFVGDGINDAPVLAESDLGFAMGALGSDAAIETADAVLMHDRIDVLAEGIRLAAKTVRIARENTFFSIGVKFGVLLLSLFTDCPMALAVFADVGVTVMAVLNALRLLRESPAKAGSPRQSPASY